MYISRHARRMRRKPIAVSRQRLRRAEAAEYLHGRLGQSVKLNTLRTWPIPYRQVGRDAVYEIADLDAFVDARLAAAPRRRAGPAPDFAAMFEERRRLLAGNGSEEEARLRAFEFVVNAHRAHFGADLETSKRAVTSAIAAHQAATKLKT